jgi:precorrin-6B C5,15-methyltransferase / cobalt-precorrin-6B C5,C15-methyltransferase
MSHHVTVIGCDGNPLAQAAAAAVSAARCVVGARRHLDSVKAPPGADVVELTKVDTALDAVCAHPGPVAVLASGDPGFFGIVRLLRARGERPAVIPAVSSVALTFARLGLPWDDALVLSAHGREPRQVLAAALGAAKTAILTAPGDAAGPWRFIPALLDAGMDVYVAECLGEPAERLTRLTAAGMDPHFPDPNIVVSVAPGAGDHPAGAGPGEPGWTGAPGWIAGHRGAPATWALPEDAFGHRDSMITKAEVRAFVLARLGPGPGRTVWDVCAGSGSVAVECARFGAHAIAVESDPQQCALIRANAAAHGVRVHVVAGQAPAALDGLLPADAVFTGGGNDEVLATVARSRPSRIVVALASVDRVRTVRDLLTGAGYQAAGTALQASRLAGLPSGSVRLAAANPVFVIWGDREERR